MRARHSTTGRSWAARLTVAAVAVAGLGLAPTAQAAPAADEPDVDLIAWYKLDETSGAVATDASGNERHGTVDGAATWNAGDGFRFSGGATGSGNAIALPDDLLAGADDVTIDFDVRVDPALSGNWFIFNLGNDAVYPDGTGYLFVTGTDSSSRLRATIADAGYASEQSIARAGGLDRGVWKHVTYVVDGGTPAEPGSAQLYEDGVLVASTDALTISPADLGEPDGSTTKNFLGRSAYPDNSFQGEIRDFRIYDGLLDAADAADRAEPTVAPAVATDAAALDLGDLSAVATDLALPLRGENGARIAWASSAPDVISAAGEVTLGAAPVTVDLTATLTMGVATETRTFTATTVPGASDEDMVEAAAAALSVPNLDDVRGNLTLPATSLGADVAWASSAPDVVTATGEVTRPVAGADAVDVELVATVTRGAAATTRTFAARVVPAPADEATTAYFFPYFTGEQAGGEKIFFGASQGNDALHWDELNDGNAVLTSSYGEKGLRDPFIIRSPEGDKFFLIATDLQIAAGGNFTQAQQTGSLHLEIWESTDLVTWSDQRHVKVSSDYAGNTWAPEAHWDEASGSYLVYWASNLYDSTETAGRNALTNYNRMMVVSTRDFVTFTEPQTWIDVKRANGRGMIDSTVIEDDGTYYRLTKDEASMTIRQEKSTDLTARVEGSLPTTTSAPGWQLIRERVGVGEPNGWGGTFTNGEGPTVFKANDGDVNTGGAETWFLFQDQPSYHGGQGYVPFSSTDLDSGVWTSVAEQADLPLSPRHGTVLPITQREYERLLASYQPDLLAKSVADAAVSTRQGVAPELPETVAVTYADGSTRDVTVAWPAVDPADYAAPGTFTVTARPVAGSPLEATVTVTVTDAAAPVVVLTTTTPAPASGWFTRTPVVVHAAASDDTAVASVELSVDGGPWESTAAATATVDVAGQGPHEVRARATDVTGNRSAVVTLALQTDSEAPVTRADVAARTVTIRSADEWSGVARVEVRLGSGSWARYSGPVTVPAAETVVQYRGVDVAGNTEVTNSVTVPAAGVVLRGSLTAAVVAPSSVVFGKQSASVRVRVSGRGGVPSGSVRVLDGSTLVATGALRNGSVKITLPRKALEVGRHRLSVVYSGDAVFSGSQDTVALRVTKAPSKVKAKVSPKKVTTRSKARVSVAVSSHGDRAGRVTVKVTSKVRGKTRTFVTKKAVVSASGKASVRLPRLKQGTYTVRVSYAGSESAAAATTTTRLVVRR